MVNDVEMPPSESPQPISLIARIVVSSSRPLTKGKCQLNSNIFKVPSVSVLCMCGSFKGKEPSFSNSDNQFPPKNMI